MKMKMRKNKTKNKVYCLLLITLSPDFSSKETDFHFHQFLSNFLRYSSSNFLSFYLYNIYFFINSLFLKSCFSTESNFSCLLTSILNIFSNSATAFFVFSKSFSLFYILFFCCKLLHYLLYYSLHFSFI